MATNNETITIRKKMIFLRNQYCKTVESFINYAAFPVILLIGWYVLTKFHMASAFILPSFGSIGQAFCEQIKTGQLTSDLTVSLLRILKGYCIAIFLGITLGVFMGVSLKTNRFFTLVFNGMRQIPALAWIPLVILWFGIGETSKVIVIANSAFFPILLNTISGIHNTPKRYIEVAVLNNVSKLDLFKKIYFPASIPFIFTGLRLGIGAAWTTVVASELIAGSSGIGFRINDASTLMQPNVVIVDMVLIGIIGSLLDAILRKVSRVIVKWEAL